MVRYSAAIGAGLAALLAWWIGALLPTPPKPTDPDVARLDSAFEAHIEANDGLAVSSKGHFLRDRDTLFWKLFTDKFGANPNTPYMWSALPLVGFLLPSPMWNLGRDDAVVLLARVPPRVEYFSFTTFALFMPRRKPKPILPFASLGDSVNSANVKHANGLFAHVVTANQRTFELVSAALVESGLPESAINLLAVPSELGLFDDVLHLGGQLRLGTYFEVVLRLFRFANQTEGDAYLRSAQPVFYLQATHGESAPLRASATPAYTSRAHAESVREPPLADDFAAFSHATVGKARAALGLPATDPEASAAAPPSVAFTPLLIKGLECLEQDTECLGDCPDAAYYGPHVRADTDDVRMLKLPTEAHVHVVTVVNHRELRAAVYGSVALLKPHPVSSATLSKARMSVRATSLGVTSFDFNTTRPFVGWAFARSAAVCKRLEVAGAIDGCSVVEEAHVPFDGYLTYCERVYLNPATGLGPHWDDLVSGQLYELVARPPPPPAAHHPMPRRLPAALPLARIRDGSETMRFFHIIKSGGESLELHLATQPSPKLDYSHCRRAGRQMGVRANLTAEASVSCAAAAAGITSLLCAANCECCAADARVEGGFHGTLLRSPRAHMLSLFSHCHTAHTQNTWGRALDDVPQYLAEVVLRSTEWTCGTYCGVSFLPEWHAAIRAALAGDPAQHRTLRVLPLHNTQAHAMTCSTARGSLGQHIRVLDGGGDALAPSVDESLASVRRFEWVGLTDLYDHSVCLLHYQANGTLPAACDCAASGRLSLGLPRMNHGVKRHEAADLPADVLSAIDAHTAVDAQMFAEALRLLLGRLRTLEDVTGRSLLACIDWGKLWRACMHAGVRTPGSPQKIAPSARACLRCSRRHGSSPRVCGQRGTLTGCGRARRHLQRHPFDAPRCEALALRTQYIVPTRRATRRAYSCVSNAIGSLC